MTDESATPGDSDEDETVVHYVCSRCGYSRRSARPVVRHLTHNHDGDGSVLEHHREPDWRDAVVRFVRDLFRFR